MVDELGHELKIYAGVEGGAFAFFVWTTTHAEQNVARSDVCLFGQMANNPQTTRGMLKNP